MNLKEVIERHHMYDGGKPLSVPHAYNMAHADRAYLIDLVERMRPFVKRFRNLQGANGISNKVLDDLLKETAS